MLVYPTLNGNGVDMFKSPLLVGFIFIHAAADSYSLSRSGQWLRILGVSMVPVFVFVKTTAFL